MVRLYYFPDDLRLPEGADFSRPAIYVCSGGPLWSAETEDSYTNYFIGSESARRYAASRRNYHPIVVDCIRELCGLETTSRLCVALDVGCGTGLSTTSLTVIADRVIGLDASQSMLDNATTSDRVEYVLGRAESIPLADESVALISTGSSFHWFDQECFLDEAMRILVQQGLLAIYTDWFSASMLGNADFETWYLNHHVERYPSPPRGVYFPKQNDMLEAGFTLLGSAAFEHDQYFTVNELTAYLLTQSNVAAAALAGVQPIEEIAQTITACVKPFFRSEGDIFKFDGSVSCYRKQT